MTTEPVTALDALKQQVLNVEITAAAQRIARTGMECMAEAGGKNVLTPVFLGANALVIAQAVRTLVYAGVQEEEALQMLVRQTRLALRSGLSAWPKHGEHEG